MVHFGVEFESVRFCDSKFVGFRIGAASRSMGQGDSVGWAGPEEMLVPENWISSQQND